MTPTATQVYRFGTSGYRTDNATAGFTSAIVQQITHAIADYWLSERQPGLTTSPCALVSYDRRPISQQRAPQVAQWLASRGFTVYLTDQDMPIPVAAFAANAPTQCGLPPVVGAVYVGASHNPPEHAGINVLSAEGAVLASAETAKIEAFQENPLALAATAPGDVLPCQLVAGYIHHLTDTLKFDLPLIAQAGLSLVYDPLYATGRHVFPLLCQQAGIPLQVIHGEDAPPAGWPGQPNPTEAQLQVLSDTIRQANSGPLTLGLANDGDADRFGVLDEQGRFVPTNDVLLLALSTLARDKFPDQPMVLVRSQASSHALDALAQQVGWAVVETPVGYKYVAETILEHHQPGKTPVGLGAEASGGLSLLGHIPEKDGTVAILLMAELVARQQQPISALIRTLRQQLPHAFLFEEFALKTTEGDTLLRHLLTLADTPNGCLGGFTLDTQATHQHAATLQNGFGTRDGVKLLFTDGSWLLFRKSGTEPLVRFVLETVAPTPTEAKTKWDQLKTALADFCQSVAGVILTFVAV
jgi:phosphoglucomutase